MYSNSPTSVTEVSTPSSNFNPCGSIQKRISNIFDEIKENVPDIYEEFENSEEESDSDPLYGEELTSKQEIKILIREILQLQEDVKDLYHFLHSKKTDNRQSVTVLSRKINDLMKILDGQLSRAETLVRKYDNM